MRIARVIVIPLTGILLILSACADSPVATPVAAQTPLATVPAVTPEPAAANTAACNITGIDNTTAAFAVAVPPAVPSAQTATLAPAPDSGQGVFVASNLKIAPDEVTEGDNVTVSLTLTNTGKQRGTHTVQVKFDGDTVGSIDVTLDGGSSQKVDIIVVPQQPGVYKLTVDQLTGKLTVNCV